MLTLSAAIIAAEINMHVALKPKISPRRDPKDLVDSMGSVFSLKMAFGRQKPIWNPS